MRLRASLAVLLITAFLATACGQGRSTIPETAVGRQLSWFLSAAAKPPIPDAELAAHFAADYLAKAPLGQLKAGLPGIKLERITGVQPAALQGVASVKTSMFIFAITVDDSGKISSLRLKPQRQALDWTAVDARLRALAPQVGFFAGEIAEGRCRTMHALDGGTPRPLASIYKLYVLGAVAERVASGRLSWNDRLRIDRDSPVPSYGPAKQWRPGTTLTVNEAATLMVASSDNTAADLLLRKVGRKAVEAWAAQRAKDPALNRPFLSAREALVLKAADYPRHADAYQALATEEGRRTYLEHTVASVPPSTVRLNKEPRRIDALEWFASPQDVCRVFADLDRLGDDRLHRVMSAHDGGLGLEDADWPTVWFKGGGEPGVLTAAFLARSATGRAYVVTLLLSNPRVAFAQEAGAEVRTLALAAFDLLHAE